VPRGGGGGVGVVVLCGDFVTVPWTPYMISTAISFHCLSNLVRYQKDMQMCMFSHYIQQCASGNSEYRFGLSFLFFRKKEYRFGLQRQSLDEARGWIIASGEKNVFSTFRKGS